MHTCDSLIKQYVTNKLIDRDKYNDLCVEFQCECGHFSIIFNKIISHNIEVEDGKHKHIIASESPSFGLCEKCMKGYDLIYKPSLPAIGLTEW